MFKIQKQRHFHLPSENNPAKQRDCHRLLRLRSRSANDTSEKQWMIGMNDDPSQYCENAPRSTSSNYSFVRFSFLCHLLRIRRNREFLAKIRSPLISVIWPWNRPRKLFRTLTIYERRRSLSIEKRDTKRSTYFPYFHRCGLILADRWMKPTANEKRNCRPSSSVILCENLRYITLPC